MHEILPKSFYERDVIDVAKNLLGQHLVRSVAGVERVGRIVEVEAYLGPHDAAAHSSKGKTARTAAMFGPAGHAYVYLIYGMYHCMNVVVGEGRRGGDFNSRCRADKKYRCKNIRTGSVVPRIGDR